MVRQGNRASLFLNIPTRGLIGARTQVLTLTRGEGVLTSLMAGYCPRTADIETRHNGVLVSSDTGSATAYSLRNLEDRGVFFVDTQLLGKGGGFQLRGKAFSGKASPAAFIFSGRRESFPVASQKFSRSFSVI